MPEFQVALKYAPGSIIGPVRTKFGSHIIYVVEKDVNDAKQNTSKTYSINSNCI